MEGAHYQNRLILTRFLVRSIFQVLKTTACPREITARDGHPLVLIRVCQGFLAIWTTLIWHFLESASPKGMPISHSHQPTWFGGCPSLTFHINPSFLEGCPSLTFHQPKFFRGVPISHFSSTRVFQRASPKKLGLMKSERWAPLWKTLVDEKWEMVTPLKTLFDEKWEMGTSLKNLGWWKVRDGDPPNHVGECVRDGPPLGWCPFQKMPNLCSSNGKKPKGVPISSCNFSGTGGILDQLCSFETFKNSPNYRLDG